MGVIDAGIADALRTADSYIAAQLTQPPLQIAITSDRGTRVKSVLTLLKIHYLTI